MKNIYLIIDDALLNLDTLHSIFLTSVCLTINNEFGKKPVSSNYFRDCVEYLFNQNDLFLMLYSQQLTMKAN